MQNQLASSSGGIAAAVAAAIGACEGRPSFVAAETQDAAKSSVQEPEFESAEGTEEPAEAEHNKEGRQNVRQHEPARVGRVQEKVPPPPQPAKAEPKGRRKPAPRRKRKRTWPAAAAQVVEPLPPAVEAAALLHEALLHGAATVRRSKRQRFLPLDYWRNEKPVYRRAGASAPSGPAGGG
jgi:hypothetical protein